MDPPVWLDKTFLSGVIGCGQEPLEVLEYDVTNAVPEGSNYFSCLYRVKLKYRNMYCQEIRSTSLVVKVPLTNGIFQDLSDKLNTVAREIEIYNIVLPQINRYLIGADTLTPKKYFSLRDDVLVLEDLKVQGFSMCDRIKQLDRDHCLCVMRALARFHASSMALHEENPELIEGVGKEILFVKDTDLSEYQMKYLKDCFTYTANGLKTVKRYETFGEMLLQQVDTTWEKLVTLFYPGTHIKVLNHGDVWTNNILFKHDVHGRVTGVKLVDFQMCRYASPGVDIQCFLMTSPDASVRHSGFSDLLDEYRKAFNSISRTLNCNIQLAAEELEEEVRSAEPYALFVLCDLLPIVVVDPENLPTAVHGKEALQSSDPNVNTFLQVYYNDRFLNLIVEHLKRLQATGFFS